MAVRDQPTALMGPQSYGGWLEIVIFAQLEGVHIGVYTRDKMARKSPLYKAREAGLPKATKKVMPQWGETARGAPHFWNILPPGVASQLRQAPGRRKVVRQGAGQLEDELPETTTIFETPLDVLCLFHALARVWNEMHPQEMQQIGQGMKRNLLEKMEDTQAGQWRDRHLRRLSKRMGGQKHTRRATGKGHNKLSKHRRQLRKTAKQGDAMRNYALHQGQNHDTHVMGVVHGTTGSARRQDN